MAARCKTAAYSRYTSAEQLPAMLSRTDVANWFGISPGTVDNWVKKGMLKPVTVLQTVRFKKEDILAM